MGAGRGSVSVMNAAAAGVPENRMLLFPDIEATSRPCAPAALMSRCCRLPPSSGLLAGDKAKGLESATPFVTTDEQDHLCSRRLPHRRPGIAGALGRQAFGPDAGRFGDKIMARYGFGATEVVRIPHRGQALWHWPWYRRCWHGGCGQMSMLEIWLGILQGFRVTALVTLYGLSLPSPSACTSASPNI